MTHQDFQKELQLLLERSLSDIVKEVESNEMIFRTKTEEISITVPFSDGLRVIKLDLIKSKVENHV